MLEGSETADVCIIGAGYTGLSSAIHLAERGYKVIVLEAETVAFGASGRNGGHVGIGQRSDQVELEGTIRPRNRYSSLGYGSWKLLTQ
jgi:gamma-glutamylputrescine oxidase